ncbi:ArnT family glycosyltransferase [Celeribacter sp. ULVN23_4]
MIPILSDKPFRYFLFGIFVFWSLLAILSPAVVYTIDEMILYAGLVALDQTGGVIIQNGYEEFGSDALRNWFFTNGPSGLAQQYPSGYTYIAYPLWKVAGIRGLFFLNVLAATGVVYLTYAMARVFADQTVARWSAGLLALSSFLVDYAVGIWPHSVAIFFALLAIYGAVRAEEEGRGRKFDLWALLGGIAFGIALNVRVDVIFILPALAVWVVWYAARPYRLIGLALLGMFPGLLISSVLNLMKFGTLLPLSYGRDGGGGGDSASTYGVLAIGLVLLFVLVVLLKHWKSARRQILVISGALVVFLIVFFPPMTQFAWHVLRGIYVLGFDLRKYAQVGIEPGIVDHGHGVVTFYGGYKKALVQSMPWLFLISLAFVGKRATHKGLMLAVSMCVLFALPFAMQEWHGGKSNSLRYFLILVPFLAFLSACGAVSIVERTGKSIQAFAIIALSALLCYQAFASFSPSVAQVLFQYILPDWLFMIGLLMAFTFMVTQRDVLRRTMLALGAVSMSLSLYLAYVTDIEQSKKTRLWFHEYTKLYREIPPKTVLYSSHAGGAFELFSRPDVLVARPRRDGFIDPDLIKQALKAGYWIAVDDETIQKYIVDTYPEVENRALTAPASHKRGELFRLP